LGDDLRAAGFLMYRPRHAKQFDGPLYPPSPFSYGEGEPPPSHRWFADSSPWNRQIPDGAALTSDSAAVAAYLLSVGNPTNKFIGVAGTTEDFEHPAYYAAANDPYVRLKIQAGSKDPSMSQTAEANIAAAKKRVTPIHNMLAPFPVGAKPAKGSDEHMVIVTGTHAIEMWKAGSWTPGELRYGCRSGATFDLNGNGLSQSGHAASASGASLLAGLIRRCELDGPGEIEHAIGITVKYVRAGVFEPTTATGSALKDPAVTAGDANDLKRPVTGSRIRLGYTISEIEALSQPAYVKKILRAWRRYGAIITDTGGTSLSIQLEGAAPDKAYGNPDRWSVFGAEHGLASAVSSGGPAGSYILPVGDWLPEWRYEVVAPF
jgi:hypothetical protein